MTKRARTWVVGVSAAAALAALTLTVGGAARASLQLRAPHSLQPSHATLTPRLQQAIARSREATRPRTADEVLQFSLEQTALRLQFGLGHRTTLTFDDAPREGNCIEYAHLFARIYETSARAAGLHVTARPVHSGDARLLGIRLPFRGWRDHDWVLVTEHDASGHALSRRYVDPTLNDLWLGWDIADALRGGGTLD